ncbi:MAG: alcohol dehydrogenase catalytic domain-containing protein [Actinomycetota bacterium]|nr:alcohol dehydrogenase catalytic domain-containing protein [Actinomycetota bacterium]
MTLCLELYRSVPRYLATRALVGRLPGLVAGPVAPLRLVDREVRPPHANGWVGVRPRLSGICGSDLNTLTGGASFYFSPLVSLPFVPGHEIVGELVDDVPSDGQRLPGAAGVSPALSAGQRVVLDPVLGCLVRGIDPPCSMCDRGEPGLCERVTGGDVSAGLQSGYCRDTAGGWGELLVAHASQLHPVPAGLSDETAVVVEPLACALRAVRRAEVAADDHVLVVGAGTVGLLTLVALRKAVPASRVTVVAKHRFQADLARRLGASSVTSPSEALGAVRRATAAFRCEPERSSPFLLGGVSTSFECVGSSSALNLALRVTRARGKVVLAGMPARADLSPAWLRELEIVGSYSGSGAFSDALELAAEQDLGRLVGATYPLGRWREAVDHALQAGSLGTVKVAFDPRLDWTSGRARSDREAAAGGGTGGPAHNQAVALETSRPANPLASERRPATQGTKEHL